MEEKIVISDQTQEMTDFLALPSGVFKNLQYQNNVSGRGYHTASLLFRDGYIYYCSMTLSVKSSGSTYYVRQGKKEGFTFDGKKVKVWYAGNLNNLPQMGGMLKALKVEWITHKIYSILTPGLFAKVLRGKITNPIDYCREYLKSVRFKTVSPTLFYKALCTERMDKRMMFKYFSHTKDPNHYLEYVLGLDHESMYGEATSKRRLLLDDLIAQAVILERSFDINWSDKRLKQLHDDWTKELMEIEANNMDDIPVKWLAERFSDIPESWELLDSQKKVYLEAKSMAHCLYTNYWNSIKNGSYAAFKVTMDDNIYTLGVHLETDGIRFNQMYGHRNSSADQAHKNTIVRQIDEFNKEHKAKTLKNFLAHIAEV
jgi:hypothetical protein